jgi:hypothetical protein
VSIQRELHVLKLEQDQGWTVQTAYEIPGWWSQLCVSYVSDRPADVRVVAVEPSTNSVRYLRLSLDQSGNSQAAEMSMQSPLSSTPDEFVAYCEGGWTGVFVRTGNQIVLTKYDQSGAQLSSDVVATDAQALIGTWKPLDWGFGFMYLASNGDLRLGQMIPGLAAWGYQTLSRLGSDPFSNPFSISLTP